MTPIKACAVCSRYIAGNTCEAFPNGIPRAIIAGENLHLTPVEGDKGRTFEPHPEKFKKLDANTAELFRRKTK